MDKYDEEIEVWNGFFGLCMNRGYQSHQVLVLFGVKKVFGG
jgi:hypothetical protein